MKEAVVLFSGGKDSTFATFCALFGGWNVILLTIKPKEDSMMFHAKNVRLTKLQAEVMGLKHIYVEAGDDELETLRQEIKKISPNAIFCGATSSEYQRERIERIGEELDIPTYSPLWHKKDVLIQEMLEYFEIYVTLVAAEGMGKKFLGKRFSELIKKLPKDINPFLEGGEGETFVADGLFFKKRIKIKKWKIDWDGVRGSAEAFI